MRIPELSLSADDRRTRALLLTASLAFHILVLAPIAMRLFEVDDAAFIPPTPPIFVEMEPRPLIEGETIRQPVAAPPAETAERPPLSGASPSVRSPIRRDRDEDEDRRSAPAPRAAARPGPGAPSAPAEANPWQVTSETMAGRTARTLRVSPAGCRMLDGRLSAGEQALCDERFNAAAAKAAPITGSGDAERDARFAREGAAAIARYEARRRPLSGGFGVSGISPDCPGGNLRGTCAGAYLPEQYQHNEDRVRQPRLPN